MIKEKEKAKEGKPKLRDKTQYFAHELRHGIVHSFPDSGVPEMTALLGELSLEPGSQATYSLTYPHVVERPAPVVEIRFVPRADFRAFAAPCGAKRGPISDSFARYPKIGSHGQAIPEKVMLTDDRPGRWVERWREWQCLPIGSAPDRQAEVRRIDFTLTTPADEGAIVFLVTTGPHGLAGHHSAEPVFVLNRRAEALPAGGSEDIANLTVEWVNLDAKHGWLWWIHPIYFAEQNLRVALSRADKQEMVSDPELPPDLPADDGAVTAIQWGRQLAGWGRICLDDENDPCDCPDTKPMHVVAEHVAEVRI